MGLLTNSLVWFGCAVSVSEILTGTYFSALGIKTGLLAILVGHLIGGILLFLAGYAGAVAKKDAMETTKISFGIFGSKFFSILNVAQLIGWTGILLFDASLSIQQMFSGFWSNPKIWALIMGCLMIVWILVGLKSLERINIVAVGALFVLTIILSIKVFGFSSEIVSENDSMSFGAAVELAAAMPLSWIPVISDWTKDSKNPFKNSLICSLIYSLVSIWMYVIGMAAAVFAGESNIALVFIKCGLGIGGLLVIVFSTVTTNYIAVYSAGISSKTLFSRINAKLVSVIATILGTLGAMFLPLLNIEGFLFLIGSVFTPMLAVILCDFFILKNDFSESRFGAVSFICWILGFIFYRLIMKFDFVLGNSILAFAWTFVINFAVHFLLKKFNKKNCQ